MGEPQPTSMSICCEYKTRSGNRTCTNNKYLKPIVVLERLPFYETKLMHVKTLVKQNDGSTSTNEGIGQLVQDGSDMENRIEVLPFHTSSSNSSSAILHVRDFHELNVTLPNANSIKTEMANSEIYNRSFKCERDGLSSKRDDGHSNKLSSVLGSNNDPQLCDLGPSDKASEEKHSNYTYKSADNSNFKKEENTERETNWKRRRETVETLLVQNISSEGINLKKLKNLGTTISEGDRKTSEICTKTESSEDPHDIYFSTSNTFGRYVSRKSSHIKTCGYNRLSESNNLQEHMKTQKRSTHVMCRICGKYYSRSDALKAHVIRIHIRDKSFSCDFCGKNFVSKGELHSHVRIHTGEQPYSCKICGAKFTTTGIFKRHMRTHTGDKPFNCEVCGKQFASKRELGSHMRTHTGEKPYGCEICGKRFAANYYLPLHKRFHMGEKPFSCEICDKNFWDKACLRRHIKTHSGERPFSCEICKRRFMGNIALKKHTQIHTGDKPFCCELCGRNFAQKGDLGSHIKRHGNEKALCCEICSRTFVVKRDLKIHLRRHTREKSFSCEICSQTFAYSGAVKTHKRMHTGERPYSCEICGDKLRYASGLKQHLRRHTCETPFRCEICGDEFRYKSKLEVHMQTHTGELAFRCSTCGINFGLRRNLNRHMQIHSGVKPYTCEICKSKFGRKDSLVIHLRSHLRK